MKGDQPGDPLALGVRQPQMPAEPVGDPAADLVVVVKARLAVVMRAGEGLPHVVDQGGEGERETRLRGQEPEDEQGMVPQVALRLHGFALEESPHRGHRRQDRPDQPDLEGHVHGGRAILVHEHPPQLLGDPLRRDGHDLSGHPLEGVPRGRFDPHVEPGREPHGAEQPQLVLAEPLRRVADGPEDLPVQVVQAADVIDHLRPRSGP